MVSSSIWDSTGTLESWATDGSFLSLSFGLCLVLEVGRPVGQQWPLSVTKPWPCVFTLLLLPPAAHFLLFHALKHYTSFKVQDKGCRPPEALHDVCSAFPGTLALFSAVALTLDQGSSSCYSLHLCTS